jgi:ABC-type sugar transport system ATPase subunit
MDRAIGIHYKKQEKLFSGRLMMMVESLSTNRSSEPILRLNGIHKIFGGIHALSGVSFDLRAGEIHALVGENGAGKSTLIKIITGAYTPDEGSTSPVSTVAVAWSEQAENPK